MLDFKFNDSIYTEVIDMYDAIALIGIIEYKDKLYFSYAIEWNPELTNCTFMLTEWNEITDRNIIRDIGFKHYLQAKLNEQKLYHLTCSFYDDLSIIRLLTKEESLTSFPTNEFKLND